MRRKIPKYSFPAIFLAILILFVTSGFFSCSFRKGKIVFMTRDYWWEAYGEQGNLKIELKNTARSKNMRFYLEVVNGKDDLFGLLDNFKGKKDTILIMDPVLSYRILKKDRRYTGESILITSADMDRNVTVSLSMKETLELAGKITSYTCLKEGFSRCVLIYPEKGIRGKVIASAFERGFDMKETDDRSGILQEAKLSDLVNKTMARRLYERYSSDGKSIYVLATYSLTPYFLDLIEKGEGYAVIMDSSDSSLANERVIFYIGYDYSRAITRGIERFLKNENLSDRKNIEIEEKAYIRWGNVMTLPDKFGKEELIVR